MIKNVTLKKGLWVTVAALVLALNGCGMSQAPEPSITQEQARGTALEHAGVTEDDITSFSIQLETDDGVKEYDVKFSAGDKKYEYDINASTGEIRSYDFDTAQGIAGANVRPSDIPPDNSPSDKLPSADNSSSADPSANVPAGDTGTADVIPMEEAKDSALSKVSGATDSDIRIHQDIEDGRVVYEGKIIYNQTEYDFEIDALTGSFNEWETESVFD